MHHGAMYAHNEHYFVRINVVSENLGTCGANLCTFGASYVHVVQFMHIWRDLCTFGAVHAHLVQFMHIWRDVCTFGAIYVIIFSAMYVPLV